MLKGILYIALASVAYGIMPVFSTQLLGMGLNSQSVVLFRFFFAALGALVLLLMTRTPLKVKWNQFFHLVLFGILGYGATAFLLTSSYQYLPIGISTMFHFSYPLFVTLIMWLMFREKLSVGKILAVVSALGGMALIAEFSGALNPTGMLLALGSGITYAVFVVANRKSAFRSLPPLVVVFYTTTSMSFVFLMQTLVTDSLIIPPTPAAWVYSVAVGWVCSLFALSMLNKAVRTIGATYAAIGNMLEPLTSLAAGAIVYGDRITGKATVGCMLVLLAVMIMALEEKIEFVLKKGHVK